MTLWQVRYIHLYVIPLVLTACLGWLLYRYELRPLVAVLLLPNFFFAWLAFGRLHVRNSHLCMEAKYDAHVRVVLFSTIVFALLWATGYWLLRKAGLLNTFEPVWSAVRELAVFLVALEVMSRLINKLTCV
jgi:hypothetical protein